MPNQPVISGSIDIEASPDVVWGLVSDLRRMGEWSPQCVRMKVFGGEVTVGTRTLNLNRQGWKRWPTNAKVVELVPGRRMAFRILENRTVWTYELEPIATGTRLTESRRAPRGVSRLSNVATQHAMGGTDSFEASLADGIRQTLERIKTVAEAA